MTKAEIDKLEAGRDTDILIAELLTGQSRLECRVDPMNRDGEPQFYWGYPVGHDFAPEYSTAIGATFEMEAEIERRGLARQYGYELALLLGCYDSGKDARDAWFTLAHASALDRCKAALMSQEK